MKRGRPKKKRGVVTKKTKKTVKPKSKKRKIKSTKLTKKKKEEINKKLKKALQSHPEVKPIKIEKKFKKENKIKKQKDKTKQLDKEIKNIKKIKQPEKEKHPKDKKKLFNVFLLMILIIAGVAVSIIFQNIFVYIVSGIIILFQIMRLSYHAKKKSPELVAKKSKEPVVIPKKGSYMTDFDRFYMYIVKNKKVQLCKIATAFKMTKKQAEEWAKILEGRGLIKINYPLIGDPELRCPE